MKKFTIIIAALMLVCFAVPAMAVDWNFYGNARMATYYESRDYDDGSNAAGTDDEDAETIWDLQGNSRFGANIKAENIKAQIEMGINESNVSARRVYGVWNFGAGSLKIGKDYTPVSQFISGQVGDGDLGLLGIGTVYGSRRGQIELAFGKFRIALIESTTGLINGMAAVSTGVAVIGSGGFTVSVPRTVDAFAGDVDDVLPKLELGWGMAFDTWNFNLMGGAQYYCIEDVTSFTNPGSSDDVEVTSWILGGDIGWNFGPGYLKAAVSYGENTGNAGWSGPGWRTSGQSGLAVWDGDDDTNDTNTFMGALVAGFKLSDMISFEGGWGYRSDITDEGPERDTEPMALYLQSVIALAPGVYVIPEVGYYDFDDSADGEGAGSLFYLGGKWQINF